MFDLEDGKIDVEGWAKAIARLAADENEYNALKSNVPTVAHKFDPRILAEKHDAAYRQVLACA